MEMIGFGDVANAAIVLANPAALPAVVAMYAFNASLRLATEAVEASIASDTNAILSEIRDSLSAIQQHVGTIKDELSTIREQTLSYSEDLGEDTKIWSLAELVHRLEALSKLGLTINIVRGFDVQTEYEAVWAAKPLEP